MKAALTAGRKSTINCVIAVLALLALPSCKESGKVGKLLFKPQEDQSGITVKVIRAEKGEHNADNTYVGSLEASRKATIYARNPGCFKRVRIGRGDFVNKGDTLAEVESQSVRSSYNMAKAKLAQAEDAWERIQKAKDGVAQVKIIELKTNLEEAQEAELSAAKALSNCTITAPFSGIVDEVLRSEGVEVSITDPLVEIIDLTSLEVVFPLPENEYVSMETGTAARVEIPAIGKSFEGRISSKGAVASKLSHCYDCNIIISGQDRRLRPGMICRVSIGKSDGVSMIIPASSVMTDMNGRYVWTVEEGKVFKRYINVGGFCADGIVVNGGIEDGTLVVTEGSRKVSVGMEVDAKF